MSNYGLQSVFEESVSAVTASNSIQLGTERWQDGRLYRYVYNMSTSTATTKHGVVHSAASAHSVTISSVGGEGLAGVVYNADIGPTEYGWVVIKGPVPLTSDGNSAIAAGDRVVLGAAGAFTRSTGGTGYTGVVVATPVEATTTAGTFVAFVNCT